MTEFLKNKKILITGGKGFLGNNLIQRLRKYSNALFAFSQEEYDLTRENEVKALFERVRPETVIHLAADIGGIEYLKENGATIFYNNIMMNSLVLEYSRRFNVKKFVGIGTALSYPDNIPTPFKEENLFKGELNETDLIPYALSKKIMLIQSQEYKKQYDFNAIHLIFSSIYGPSSSLSHAIPSIIKRFRNSVRENTSKIEIWGTGDATRDYLYVDDASRAIILATQFYNKAEPVNIGSGKETKISELAKEISNQMNFRGDIIYDSNKPEGEKRMFLDSSKAEREFGFKAKISLEEGLKRTIKSFADSDK